MFDSVPQRPKAPPDAANRREGSVGPRAQCGESAGPCSSRFPASEIEEENTQSWEDIHPDLKCTVNKYMDVQL